MKFTISLISVTLLTFCECRQRVMSIYLSQDINDLNKNYFDKESYEDEPRLRIELDVLNSNYTPAHIEDLKLDFLKRFPNVVSVLIWAFDFTSFDEIKFANQLKLLNLPSNKIKVLKRNQLKNLVNLEELNLHENDIEVLLDEYLANNKKLQKIYFAKNKLRAIPEGFFKGLTDLKIVDFQSNQLNILPQKLFEDNKKLQEVLFSYNLIHKLSPRMFDGIKLYKKHFHDNPCAVGEWNVNSKLDKCFADWEKSFKFVDSDKAVCGKSLLLQDRIFFGTEITRGKYPWISAFYYQNSYQCGSSLISRKHVLLAAHCIHDKFKDLKDPKDCKFSLGKFNLTAPEPDSLDAEILEFIMHPEWDPFSYEWRGDVAVAVLKKEVEFSMFIRPLCLNEDKFFNFYNKTGTIVGWGATEKNPKEGNDVALELDLIIYEPRDCLTLNKDLVDVISQTSFCAGNRDNSGSCIGDSGSTLIVQAGNQYKAIGIVSVAAKTIDHLCDTSKNQIYTEVAAYYGWIVDQVIATY